MVFLQSIWVEKEKKKRTYETSPAYGSDPLADPFNSKNTENHHTNAARAIYKYTLRGVRK
jgi:hypothetical protein